MYTDAICHGALAGFLKENSVDTLICGGIGNGAKQALAEAGIKLYGGVVGNADSAVNDLLQDKLNFNENVHCEHHDHSHHEGHCGEHKKSILTIDSMLKMISIYFRNNYFHDRPPALPLQFQIAHCFSLFP